ncbi:MAG: acyl-CoA dehydrogenase family protein [Actinobacteria bacterium]|nr:acyl-CoA dehydrogenase family protein [Actinomycetota bacterium]
MTATADRGRSDHRSSWPPPPPSVEGDTEEDARFRAEARAWLRAHAQERAAESVANRRYASADNSPAADAAHVRRCKEWQRTLFEGGFAGINVPREYGGGGGTSKQARIFAQEQARFDVETGVFAVGHGMVIPTLLAHGTEEQKQRYIPSLLRGDEIWCQLYSEPSAGSDLAGLRTRAVRDGDEWIVNGQKVWNSGAHHSDMGILLARTDVDVPKHRGITYFLVDMHSPGIEVRPLRQINGVAHFNEVFLSDVRIPMGNVLGEVNGGWGVAQTTLANERTMIGGGTGTGFGDFKRLAREYGRTDDPILRQRLADAFIRFEILRYLGARAQAAIRAGKIPGPESSVLKLAVSEHVARNGDLGLALEGASGMLINEDAAQNGLWQQLFLGQWGVRIGGGTEQVQRNVLGERVLGLPGEPRPDKTMPFRDLPTS